MKILLVGSFFLLELVCARYACSVVYKHGFALEPGSAFELWDFHDLFLRSELRLLIFSWS